MDTTTAPETSNTDSPRSALPYWLGLPLLGVGPTLTARLLIANHARSVLVTPGALPAALLVLVVVLWSPLPLSIPSAILQFARDGALANLLRPRRVDLRLWRAVRLIPHLALSPASNVRAEMVVSLAGWVCGVALALPYLQH